MAAGFDWQQAKARLRQGKRADSVRFGTGGAPGVEVQINNAAQGSSLQTASNIFIFVQGV